MLQLTVVVFSIYLLIGGFSFSIYTRLLPIAANINLHKAANQATEAATDIMYKLLYMSL